MVFLTMTPAMVSALETVNRLELELENEDNNSEYSLADPAIGNPIEHSQIIGISKLLESHNIMLSPESTSCHLDHLLRGSRIYEKPPKKKQEPTSSYKTLMDRLRREEEARVYERMINPPVLQETFAQRFPASQTARLFPTQTHSKACGDDDEITYADINRQMTLIINIVVSILACSIAIWMASSHWTTPKRLGLSMGGSGLVGVGEVVVYAGYLRRLKEAREKGRKHLEIKEILKTWVIGCANPIEEKVGFDPTQADVLVKEGLRKRRVT